MTIAAPRPFLLGLTGSIGMGKSTTAAIFRAEGIPVWDADAAVHRLYSPGGGGAGALRGLVPQAITGDAVDRDLLRRAIIADGGLLARIEAAVHPLVAVDRRAFLAEHAGAALIVCDIPLLYETGAEAWLDAVLVVTAPLAVQRERVLARPGMTEDALGRVLSRQLPDADKRARADHLLDTDKGIEAARARVLSLIAEITARRINA